MAFRHGSALALSFADGAFDVVWIQHATLNIAEKERLYREIHRVLRPGGRLAMQEVIAGTVGPLHFPVPWAGNASISFLRPAAEIRALLAGIGFGAVDWVDERDAALSDLQASAPGEPQREPRPFVALLLGPWLPETQRNVARNLREERLTLVQAVFEAQAGENDSMHGRRPQPDPLPRGPAGGDVGGCRAQPARGRRVDRPHSLDALGRGVPAGHGGPPLPRHRHRLRPAGTHLLRLRRDPLLTTATLDRLRALYPQGRFAVRRFRPNIVVQASGGQGGFIEQASIGHTLAIGAEVRLRVMGPCLRCVMTTLAQGDLPKDPGILRTAAQHNQVNVGLYASVLQGGTVRCGDPVWFTP